MKDGHIHTPYCPHGSSDPLKTYVEQAITLGYKTMSFTEHAPLPNSFVDPAPTRDSSMSIQQADSYVREVNHLKLAYQKDININLGFEVDFIQGYEQETKQFLNEYGPEIDDSILSVHFLCGNKQWYCIDYSSDMYLETMKDFGSNDLLYHSYFKALTRSVKADLGPFKPKRIGHLTLVRKFHKLYPSPNNWEKYAYQLLRHLKEHQLEIDYNSAGTKKPHCEETYPPLKIAKQASSMGIPLIYGSDAHTSLSLKQGFTAINQDLLTH